MTTKLDRPLKREIEIDGVAYTLTLMPTGLKLIEKGKRKGRELEWRSLVSGEAALAVALNASLQSEPKRPVEEGRGARGEGESDSED